ncbi:nucleotide sugar dehydrogenase [bacterium]|nr:nucleotide sugar dehydrogenase [bacterium]
MNGIDWLCVEETTPLIEVLRRQAGAVDHGLSAGIALVVDEKGTLVGAITDGDIRRTLLANNSLELNASNAMTKNPIVFPEATSYRMILKQLPLELEKRGRRAYKFLGKIILVDENGRPKRIVDYHQLWEQRVATHRHVIVLGLGYVGLTLALELAEEGINVTGVDVEADKVKMLSEGKSYVVEPGIEELLKEQLQRGFRVSTDVPADGDVFILAVGTPVHCKAGEVHPMPDLSYIRSAAKMVGEVITPGALVVLRSTVPVGCTREIVLPVLEEASGLKVGNDIHLTFAPERTVEGNALAELRTLPQIIGGVNDDSVEATVALFRELTPTIVRMESLEAAEMAKLINNSFRDYKFAFANEIAQICSQFNLDVNKLIRAANHGYPRDPVPLPSPGVGGPCLTKDPYILASADQQGIDKSLSYHARRVNESMHEFVADSVIEELQKSGKNPFECSILICGLAFKGFPETGDLRNSSPMEIAHLLEKKVAKVYGYDPVASAQEIEEFGLTAVGLKTGFDNMDAVLFLNNHVSFKRLNMYETIRKMNAPALIYDAWDIFREEEVLQNDTVVYMGLGFTRSAEHHISGEN